MLRVTFYSVITLLMLTASGCALPQNPQEFRQQFGPDKISKFSVDRPYKEVVGSLTKNAERCLHKRVTYPPSWEGGQLMPGGHNDYKPTLKTEKNRTMLTFQTKSSGIMFMKMPEDGFYIYVADIFSNAQGGTNVDLYYGYSKDNPVITALIGWLNGRDGCPDLAKTW